MHSFKLNKIAVSMAVGTALVASWYPANLNAITAATSYQLSAEEATNIIAATGTSTPEALAQTMKMVVGQGEANASEAQAPEAASEAEATVKEPEPIDVWLEKLAYQESNHRAHIKVLDVNGKYSYGCLQFQEGTFRHYGMKYGLISQSTPFESVIYDCDLQKKLAKLMLEDNYYNWQAWYTSVKKMGVGLPPQI